MCLELRPASALVGERDQLIGRLCVAPITGCGLSLVQVTYEAANRPPTKPFGHAQGADKIVHGCGARQMDKNGRKKALQGYPGAYTLSYNRTEKRRKEANVV